VIEHIKTTFSFSSTVHEVVQGIDLTGKQSIVPGGASGIGIETARGLAMGGAAVTLAVRRPEVGEGVAADIQKSTGNPNVRVARLDLSDQSSVREFAADWQGPLHILVDNAGIMALPRLERSPEDWEIQFATTFLRHFTLTRALLDALEAAGGARIVSVNSSANMITPVIFDDLHFKLLPYEPFVAYGQSKTVCVLLAAEATRRWAGEGLFANALNPGAIATNLQKHTGGLKTPPERRKTPRQGAATSVLLATSPLIDGVGGRYFEDCNEATVVSRRPADFSGGVAPYAIDPSNVAARFLIHQLSLAASF
jgi:NAD(P)-dependent dehydrogenase (short-subunit alcohol dehydrogenase family)